MSEVTGFYKALPNEVFAILDSSRVGYIKTIRSEEVAAHYPGVPELEPGRRIFVVHAADGTPIAMGSSRESVMSIAAEQQIDAVSVH